MHLTACVNINACSLLGTGRGVSGGPGSLSGRSTVSTPAGSCCVVANIPVVLALSDDQFSQALAIKLHAFEFEDHGLSNDGFLLSIAHRRKHWMLQALLQRYAIVWVKDQDLLEEVDSLSWRAWVLLL